MPNYISDGSNWYKTSQSEQQQYIQGYVALSTIKSTRAKHT